jgi:hypothetical protein
MSVERRCGTEDKPERRRPRLAVDLAATVSGRDSREARVVDLSLVGCLVRSAAALDPGAVVDLQVELPDGRRLRAKTRVAEASIDGDSLPAGGASFLAGVEFLDISAADEILLRAFLAAEAKRRRGAHAAPP